LIKGTVVRPDRNLFYSIATRLGQLPLPRLLLTRQQASAGSTGCILPDAEKF
jgi:hypothetical protein